MADNIIDKADSLMRRHRAFVAGDQHASPVPQGDALRGVSPEPTFAKTAEPEDIPVLTEVVAAIDDATLPVSSDIESLLQERLAAALPQQREVLRRELALWLDEQLPQIVLRVLDGVTDQLVAQINTQARMTLLPKLQTALEADTEAPPAD